VYSAIESYIRHAEKDNRPELVKLWNKIKDDDDDDEQNHLKMLRNVLIGETRDNRFFSGEYFLSVVFVDRMEAGNKL
jgi:hypothetical protein